MSTIDDIKSRLDIADIVSEHVPLKKAGRNFKGLCPFHSEKTPSFFVFPDTQTWHCFGACQTGGDLFAYVMRHDHLEFAEALQVLAQKAGVQLEPPRTRDSEREKQLDKLLDIHAAATTYFHELLLHSAEDAAARAYVARRGLNEETIRRFQVGYAPDAWRGLTDHLLLRGYERPDLLEAGLIILRDDGGYHDRFRGRLMIPIRDTRGRVIGFGGRILDKGEPKYLNSPQTPLFNKSQLLFGLDMAKASIRAQGCVVIVEGYMDVLQAHQGGFANVVATMGTALTEQQLALLKRMTHRYVLALDPDAAGDQATLRGLAVAREVLERQTVPVPTARGWIRYESRLNADIRIMALPAGQDPDDLIRDAPASWEPLVQAATPLVDYYFQIATRDLDLTSAKSKSEIVDRLVPILTEIRDEVERTHYVQKLARLIRADEGTIRRKLAAARTSPEGAWQTGRRRSDGPRDLVTEQPASPVFAMEEHLLTVLFRYPAYLERINTLLGGLSLAPLQAEDLERVESRALFAAWIQVQEGMDWQEWVDTLPSALQEHLRFLLAQGPDSDQLANEEAQRDIERTALLLRQRRLGRLVDHLKVLQAEAREQGEARVRDYDQTLVSLHQDKFRVHRAVSRLTAMARREEKEKAL